MKPGNMNLTGKKIFIRTVTNYYTGEVMEETSKFLLLIKAAWIADTGRFSQALEKSSFFEVELYPHPVYIMKAAIVDITEIDTLPTEIK